jgi:hypothetical protein
VPSRIVLREMTMRLRNVLVLAGALAATFVVASLPTSATVVDDTNPATAPQPEYDYSDTSKSFLVDLEFGATSASLVQARVGNERSYSHLGDPALLRVSLTDDDGAAAGAFDSWDPRWVFDEAAGGGERLIVRPGQGTITTAFDGDVAVMLVRDQQAGTDLATVDLRPAVRAFCAAHPDDAECVEADLAVTSTTATGDPLGVVGQAVAVTVAATIANLGPDGPVDGDVTQTATASGGATITPGSLTIQADNLAVGSPATVTGQYSVTCDTAGAKTVTVSTSVVPEKAKVVDLVGTNNSRSATFAIDCAVPVTVNVKPGSLRNPVNVNEGAIPIAVLTTAAGEYGNPLAFDATAIQGASVRIGARTALVRTNTGAPETHGRIHLEDVVELDETTEDGDSDAMLHARATAVPVVPTTTELCVRGRFGPGSGAAFFGCDHVEVVP